jgi:ABC-type nickel/cobalt efflux system permease component RcnA
MEFYHTFIKQVTIWQYELNKYITTSIKSVNDDSSAMIFITVLGIAFLYGLIHAAGPGHGKAIVGFYFTGNNQSKENNNYLKAFEMGYLISIVHTISALITTFSLYFILKTMFYKNFRETYDNILHVSAMMIIVVGLYIIYEAYKNKNSNERLEQNNKSKYMIAFSAGVVPCPGVMTVVLFSVIQKKFLLAICSAIAMSIGMGLTISLVGILGILFRKKTTSFTQNIGYILQMLSGVIIILLGAFLVSS